MQRFPCQPAEQLQQRQVPISAMSYNSRFGCRKRDALYVVIATELVQKVIHPRFLRGSLKHLNQQLVTFLVQRQNEVD